MKVAFVVGTRPEIIKICPLIRHCENEGIDYFLTHSGQHYSYNMDKLFFEELNLKMADHQLNIKSSSPDRQGEHTGKMMIEIEDIFLQERPTVVFAHGDTNTALATGLVSAKISSVSAATGYEIRMAHIEAGLRSFDRKMPEEINRQIIDHLSNYLFPPTITAKENLLNEGIVEDSILLTGNTIVDSVLQNIKIANERCNTLQELELEDKGYFLATVHRQESVDVKERLLNIVNSFKSLYDKYKVPVVFPMHPRTKKMVENFNIEVPEGIKVIEPVGFLDFLQLEACAKLILTDSGGIQEESCILKVPCVTLRNNTERPETLTVGSNVLAGYDPDKIIESVDSMLSKDCYWDNPFGDGMTSKRIMDYIISKEAEA